MFLISLISINAFGQVHNPYFYEIKYENKKSYILGSLHYGISINEFPQIVLDKFNEATTHVYEMIANTTQEFELIQSIHISPEDSIARLEELRFFDKSSNSSILSKEAQSILVGLGFPEELATRTSDNACSAVLFREILFTQRIKSIDQEFLKLSEQSKKKIVELENQTIRDQAELLDRNAGITECSIENLISQHFGFVKNPNLLLDPIYNNYRYGVITDTDETDPSMIFRNKEWMPLILKQITEGNAFIVVGRDHLYGEHGLLKRLEFENEFISIRKIEK